MMGIGDFLRNATVQKLAQDALMRMDAETAHRATINALKFGLVPSGAPSPTSLAISFCGLDLPNPIGMAPVLTRMRSVRTARQGRFRFCGSRNGHPETQKGNPTPRVFRIPDAMGVINRLGFNNEGHQAAFERLKTGRWARSLASISVPIRTARTSLPIT